MSSKVKNWWQRWLITADELKTRAGRVVGSPYGPIMPSPTPNLSDLEPRILFSATPIDPAMMPGGDETAMVVEVDSQESAEQSDLTSIATVAQSTPQSLRELVIIDSAVPDIQQLLDDLSGSRPDADVFVLDGNRDGLDQITEILDSRSEVSSIHVVSHGENNAVKLGNIWLGESNLAGYAGQIASWQTSLTSDADILFYGCDLASEASGQSFIDSISALTGADVAASTDDTGHARYNADWEFEYTTGAIGTEIAFSTDLQANWFGKLSTITVTTFDDVVSAIDGETSLREAITLANLSGGDTIDLSTIGPGTFTLTIGGTNENANSDGDLDILKDVTIYGMDARSTIIDASAIGERAFHIKDTSVATLSGLTIRGGNQTNGGGIFVDNTSTLYLSDALLTNNTSDRGGAIHVHGTAHLDRVLLYNNSAVNPGLGEGQGGGIHFHGADGGSLTNVTISGNTAEDFGGGLWTDSTITITNSTIAFNDANNGGGIRNDGGTVNISNSIVTGNTANSSNQDVLGSFASDGSNLIEFATGGTGFGGDITGVSANLVALANNGGQTDTHALRIGSLAIDAGTPNGAASVDGRGLTRDDFIDIGAFEFAKLDNTTELRVNATEPDQQVTSAEDRGSQQAVSMAADGSYVVVWSSLNQDGSGQGVYARRFDSTGAPLTTEKLVNFSTTNDQQWARVASAADGSFVVTWTSNHGATERVNYRRFDASGNALTGELVANTTVSGDQRNSVIAMNAVSGDFVIAWQGNGEQPGHVDSSGIFAQRFDSEGVAIGGEFRVNTDTPSTQSDPAIDVNENGDFVVVWDDGAGVHFQRFNNTGTQGGQTTIDGSNVAGNAAVAVHSDGSFVVTWREGGLSTRDVYFRRYSNVGAPLTGIVTVNTTTSNNQTNPSISMDSGGNFIIVWEGEGVGDDAGVFAQKYDITGAAVGGNFLVNQTLAGSQNKASVAMGDSDNFVVVWSGNGDQVDEADTSGVFTRVYGTIDVNDAPTLSATPSNPTFTEDGPAVGLFSGAVADTIESGQTFTELTLTVANVTDGADEILGADGVDIALTAGNTGTTATNSLSYSVSVTGGTATVTLGAGNLSAVELQSLVDTLNYRNDSDKANTANRVVTLTAVKDSGGGDDTATLNIDSTVMVSGVNDAPTLSGGPFSLTGTNEDTISTGVQVSTILAGLTSGDADNNTLGLAIITAAGNGTWQYSTDSTDGSDGTWTSFGPVDADSALLLSDTTWVRYQPDLVSGETANLTFAAWDGTNGAASTAGSPSTADPDGGGGTLAYSNTTAQANLVVTDVNDDPTVANPIADQVTIATDPLSFQFAANTFDDVDGNSLTYTTMLSGGGSLPTWLSFDATSRTFSGTPTVTDTGDITIRVTANDGNTGSEFDEFVLTVAPDTAPTDLIGTATKLGGLSLNEDGGNNAYLIADGGDAIASGLSALTMEVQFSSTTRPAVGGSATFLSYANGVSANGDDLRFGVRRTSGTVYELEFGIDDNMVHATSFDAGLLFDGETHRASVTWDNAVGEYTFHVDGLSVDSGSGLAVGHTMGGGGTLTIGTDQDTPGGSFENNQVFRGTLLDLRIFGDVRTSSEIQNNANNTLRYDTPGMLANWTFNDLSTEGVITDKVGGNNLTVRNVAVGGGFSDSQPELTYAVSETAGDGTFIGRVAGIDAEREAVIAQLLAADPTLSYSAETGKFYQYVATTETWSDAQATATATDLRGVNGQLVTILSAAEQEFVHAIAAGQTIWLGASDQSVEGDWHWYKGGTEESKFWSGDETGTTVGDRYQNWNPAEPNDPIGDQDFVRMIANGSNDGLWEDATAADSHAYIVEWNADEVLDQTDALTYSMVDDAGGRFAIHGDTGTISIADGTLIDYETTTSHSVTVRITDSAGNIYDESFTIDVREVNEAPITDTESYVVTAGRSLSVTAPGVLDGDYDPEGDSFTAVLLVGTTDGTLTLNPDGSFVYTPNAAFIGTDSFSYEAWDGSASSASTLVTIDVSPAIIPPTPPPVHQGGSGDPGTPDEPTEEEDNSGEEGDEGDAVVDALPGIEAGRPNATTPTSSASEFLATTESFGESELDSSRIFAESQVQNSGNDSTAGSNRPEASHRTDSDQLQPSTDVSVSVASTSSANYVLMTKPGAMWSQLDQQRDQMESQIQGDLIVVGAAGAAASSFTVGVVAWALRTGFLASGLLAQMPAWRAVDPMMVMQGLTGSEDGDNETLEELMKRQSQSLDETLT